MKKLLLRVDDLVVESFATAAPRGRGTVDANATTLPCATIGCEESRRPTCGIQPAADDGAVDDDLGTDYTPCFVCCM